MPDPFLSVARALPHDVYGRHLFGLLEANPRHRGAHLSDLLGDLYDADLLDGMHDGSTADFERADLSERAAAAGWSDPDERHAVVAVVRHLRISEGIDAVALVTLAHPGLAEPAAG